MQDLNKLTPTQLLKKGNDIKARHDALKQEIFDYTHEIEKLEKQLNEKVIELQELEKNYVEIVEILNK
jgi:uncharacterized coiled-coil DUF342 family protein